MLTGKDDADMSYMALNPGPCAGAVLPALSDSVPSRRPALPPAERSAGPKSNFRPTYD